ncbi:MAG: hypothetical protein ACK4MV_08225 [Beijerinckiaceae bacterium]
MADLSDSDKRAILGAGYKKVQAERDALGGQSDEKRTADRRVRFAADMVSGAIGVGLLAALIGIANFYSRGTPYNASLVVGCVVVILASAATAAWFSRWRRNSL